ncbi:hypothetical protein O6H91_20G014400 [Diphasiastrum complanatum]|uniref:Uncharacterized protein n=1 Tax=Diphasiastrum complanatum TaxID=34168 RepID=A0ACC2AN30_DIPCM|nr:hypothetical protein O6H91_Y567500 [Diphasiastrum complanatum]KAJ7518901.1 hypothetical protein O6H91_20G014400 [Diphasiastrum complanatum]
MAFLKLAFCLMIVVLLLSSAANAQCNPKNYGVLGQCLTAVGNQQKMPSKSCCNSLKPFQGKAQCLCDTLIAAKKQISSINIGNALKVPKICGYNNYVPHGFKCNGEAIP